MPQAQQVSKVYCCITEPLLMLFVVLFYTSTATHKLLDAFLLQAHHIEYLSVMITPTLASQVFHFRSSLHFTRYYYEFALYNLHKPNHISHLNLMERTEQQWLQLTAELTRLRQENQQLKKELQDFHLKMIEPQLAPMRSSIQPPKNKCRVCHRHSEKSRKQMAEELQIWSQRLNSKFLKKTQLRSPLSEENSVVTVHKEQEHIDVPQTLKQMNLFEAICLYGPSQLALSLCDNTKNSVSHQLYFPFQNQGLQAYGNYLYPEQVATKLIRQKNKIMQIDRVIFRKSLKQTDCTVFIFQCQQDYEQIKKTPNPLCKQINPFKSLFCIALEFPDYLYSAQPYMGSATDRTYTLIEEEIPQDLLDRKSKDSAKSLEGSMYGPNSIYRSSFRLCVLSYFPFINFFADLLIKLIDQIKIRRMQERSKKGSEVHQLDIKYVSKELENILNELAPTLKTFSIKEGISLLLQFGQQKLKLQLQDKTSLRCELGGGWVFKMLRLMDKQILYDIYCMIMLQESLCFFCQNANVLTFFIYLFVGVLMKPFSYPHPVVSMVFEQDLLQTPFTAILGINKNTDWLQVNHGYFEQKMEGKIIVNLNDEEIKIKSKKKINPPKSQKLRKIITNFYKKADKLQGFSKKRDILQRQTTKAQNELAHQFLQQMQNFIAQQITVFLPNRQIIESIRSSIPTDNMTLVSTKLIKAIQQYMAESRKNHQHDPFIDQLMQKQIFYVFLTLTYDIA